MRTVKLVLVEAGQRGNVGIARAHRSQNHFRVDFRAAFRGDALAVHFGEHAKDIQHGQINAVVGELRGNRRTAADLRTQTPTSARLARFTPCFVREIAFARENSPRCNSNTSWCCGSRTASPLQAAQPSGSDSPMIIGMSFNSGNDAMTEKPDSCCRNSFAMPMRTWPFTKTGEPFA